MSLASVSRPTKLLAFALLVATTAGSSALAQSGTKTAPRTGSTTRSGAMMPMTTSSVGLEGYCPVCVVEMKKWVKGNASVQAKYDGKTYYFPGDDQRKMFLANPSKYAPALGGDCAVCVTDMKKKMPGSVHFSALHRNRLYLFPNEEIKQKFLASPNKYADADLALGGNCVVCKVEMKQDVLGNPQFTTTHGGMRYQFPSEEQQKMFVANPMKYVKSPAMTAGSGTK